LSTPFFNFFKKIFSAEKRRNFGTFSIFEGIFSKNQKIFLKKTCRLKALLVTEPAIPDGRSLLMFSKN